MQVLRREGSVQRIRLGRCVTLSRIPEGIVKAIVDARILQRVEQFGSVGFVAAELVFELIELDFRQLVGAATFIQVLRECSNERSLDRTDLSKKALPYVSRSMFS